MTVRIETERLLLVPHELEHFEPLAAMWADPEVVRHIGGRRSTRHDSWMRLLRYRGLWPLLGYGYWAIVERASGRFVGDLGFADFHRPLEPSIEGLPEAGWILCPWAQRRGYGGEALRAALAWLDRRTAHARSVCLISPANVPSLRLAERHGYGSPRSVRFLDEDTLLLTRDAARRGDGS